MTAAARGAVFRLADYHPSILQRMIDLCDEDDLFLLRLVAQRFRDAVGPRIERLCPSELPTDLAAKFPNLVSLDLTLIPPEDAPSLTPLLPRQSHLRELGLHKYTTTQNHLAHEWMPTLRTLTRLHLSTVEDSEVLVGFAGQCSSLQRLEASGSGEGLQWEAMYRVVARLADTLVRLELPPDGEVQQDMVGHSPAQCLLPLNTGKLQFLRFHRYEIGDEAIFTQLRAFTSLTALDIGANSITAESIAELCALTRLTSLCLGTCAYAGADIAQLAQLPHLADLHLHRIEVEDDPEGGGGAAMPLGNALAELRSLRQLELVYCDGTELGTIAGAHSRLTKLVLNNARLRDQPRCLQPLTGLRSLRLFWSLWEEAQLRYLSGMLQLTSLDLSAGQLAFTAIGAGWLARLTALQQLFLGQNHSMTASALERLASLPALRVLDLNSMELPPLAPLARLPLAWLRLPAHYRSADELPEPLRVPFLRGRSYNIHRMSSDAFDVA